MADWCDVRYCDAYPRYVELMPTVAERQVR
jgi:hypothetical protein